MKQSPTLTLFYRYYLAWAKGGARGKEFNASQGLCGNFIHMFPIAGHLGSEVNYDAYYEMKRQFVAAGLDRLYPFGGECLYDTEVENDLHHLNTERLAWVEARV